jgi:hypothetical protein
MRVRAAAVIASLLCGLTLCCPAIAAPRSKLAPADEYFGRFAMSPLEITNRIRDAERRGPSYQGLVNTQAAIEDWTRKYPRDPWIPPREYRIARLFARIRSHAAQREAAHCRAFLRAHFASISY